MNINNRQKDIEEGDMADVVFMKGSGNSPPSLTALSPAATDGHSHTYLTWQSAPIRASQLCL